MCESECLFCKLKRGAHHLCKLCRFVDIQIYFPTPAFAYMSDQRIYMHFIEKMPTFATYSTLHTLTFFLNIFLGDF